MKKYILGIYLFLGGCVSIPEHEKGQVAPLSGLEHSVQEAMASGDFQSGSWPDPSWWEMFDAPDLAYYIRLGIEESPSLKHAAARVDAAKQIAKEKRAVLFPELDASYEETWAHLSKNGLLRFAAPTFPAVINLIDLALNFQYEFDFWGKNSNVFKAALGKAHAEIAEYAQAKLILTTAIATTYFDLYANRQKLKILKEILRSRSNYKNLVKDRLDHGLDTNIEHLNANQDVYGIEQSIARLESATALSGYMLNTLVGRGPDTPLLSIENSTSEVLFSFPLPENIALDLLARRPDLMAQIWRMESAAHAINAAKANFYPNFNLTALAGLESVSFKKLFRADNAVAALSPAIHLPIFTAGRLRAELDTRVAFFNEAVYSYNELLLRAAEEVASGLINLAKTNEEARVQKKTVEAARQVQALNFLRYTQGVVDYLTVLSSEQSYLQQKFTAIDLTHEQLLKTITLIKALGGGYE